MDSDKLNIEEMAIEHPYYCSDNNFYSNEPRQKYKSMSDFLDDFEHMDIDLNLMFRWDIHKTEDKTYFAEVFLMLQRKGIFKPMHISSVSEEEIPRFKKYARLHWERLNEMWNPISNFEVKKRLVD